jgi:hypothetical protein
MTARQNKILKRRLANERERRRVRERQQPRKAHGIVVRLGETYYDTNWIDRTLSNVPRCYKGRTVVSRDVIFTFAPKKLDRWLLGRDLVVVRAYKTRSKSASRLVTTRMVKILESVPWGAI